MNPHIFEKIFKTLWGMKKDPYAKSTIEVTDKNWQAKSHNKISSKQERKRTQLKWLLLCFGYSSDPDFPAVDILVHEGFHLTDNRPNCICT
jgi:hypothetical protein